MLPHSIQTSYFLVDKTEYPSNFDFTVLSDVKNLGYSQAIKELKNKLLVCLEGELFSKYSQFDQDTPLELIFTDDSFKRLIISAT